MRTLTLALSLLFALPTFGASLYKRALTMKKGFYLTDGVVTGGIADGGASLLAVRHGFFPKAKVERVVVDLGDRSGKPSGKKIGYYQVSVDSKNNRIVFDLDQLKLSMVSEPKLRALFRKSAYVASSGLTIDPEDRSATMVLNLKRPVQAEVFEVLKDGKPSHVVIDLKPRPVAQ